MLKLINNKDLINRDEKYLDIIKKLKEEKFYSSDLLDIVNKMVFYDEKDRPNFN